MSRRSPISGRTFCWALCGMVLALAVITTSLRAEVQECSDFTTDNRPCTAMEEYGYCLHNAIESYYECSEGGGTLRIAACYIAYVVDFWACATVLPLAAAKNLMD
jgi:hypothetical protein